MFKLFMPIVITIFNREKSEAQEVMPGVKGWQAGRILAPTVRPVADDQVAYICLKLEG